MRFAHYSYEYMPPCYHYNCAGFRYSVSNAWWVMDDFGDAVISVLRHDPEQNH